MRRETKDSLRTQRDILAEWSSYSGICPMAEDYKCPHKISDRCDSDTIHPECWVLASEFEMKYRESRQ